jgi:hypothetical protein
LFPATLRHEQEFPLRFRFTWQISRLLVARSVSAEIEAVLLTAFVLRRGIGIRYNALV